MQRQRSKENHQNKEMAYKDNDEFMFDEPLKMLITTCQQHKSNPLNSIFHVSYLGFMTSDTCLMGKMWLYETNSHSYLRGGEIDEDRKRRNAGVVREFSQESKSGNKNKAETRGREVENEERKAEKNKKSKIRKNNKNNFLRMTIVWGQWNVDKQCGFYWDFARNVIISQCDEFQYGSK